MPSPKECGAKFKPGSKQYKDCIGLDLLNEEEGYDLIWEQIQQDQEEGELNFT